MMPGTATDQDVVEGIIEEMLNVYPDAMLVSGAPQIDRHADNVIATVEFSSKIYDRALRIASQAIFSQMEFYTNSLKDAPFLTDDQSDSYIAVIQALIDRVKASLAIEEEN